MTGRLAGRKRGVALLVVAMLAFVALAGCVAPPPSCDARAIVADGVGFLASVARPSGGVPPGEGGTPEPRTTAWALLAAGLARRTGHEGSFAAGPHVEWLLRELPGMMSEASNVDSVANNLSLARVALQSWGRPAGGIAVEDPAHPEAKTLAAAWEARYNNTSGAYGDRLNEHLFATFAAWLFEPAGERLFAMGDHVAVAAAGIPVEGTADTFDQDAWWAGYARLALGPKTPHEALASRLENVLEQHQDADGGVRGFATARFADASTTAAALLGWMTAGEELDGAHVASAIAWLCDARNDDGSVSFAPEQDMLRVKTTAEVVASVSLLLAPVPWAESG